MTYKRFVIGDVLGFGWNVMKTNLWFFVGVALIVGLIRGVPQVIMNVLSDTHEGEVLVALLSIILMPVFVFINVMFGIGFTKIALSFCDARKPPFGTLFDFKGCFWRYVGASILQTLIVMAGLLLIIIPAILVVVSVPENPALLVISLPVIVIGCVVTIYLTIKFSLCQYFVIDKHLSPLQSIKASGRTTKGAMWKLFGFGILCSLIILLGLLCLIVGVFAAYPIVMVANALVYRHLAAQTPELAEFNIDTTYSAAAGQGTGA